MHTQKFYLHTNYTITNTVKITWNISYQETYHTTSKSNTTQFRAYVIPHTNASSPNSLTHGKFQEKKWYTYYHK